MLVLQEQNDRYSYVLERAVRTGPHTHNVPIGCEPAGSECTGCIYVEDNSDIEVRLRDGRLKERVYADDSGVLRTGRRPR